MLTQEMVKELFEYRDGELYWRSRKYGHRMGVPVGSTLKNGYKIVGVGRGRYILHRLIFLYHHGYFPESGITHINNDRSNNRIENLAEESAMCRRGTAATSKSNKSGVTGVSWRESRRKWEVNITSHYKLRKIKESYDFTEAVAHRLAAEQCLGWGDCHNPTTAYLYMKEYLNEARRQVS